MVIEIVFVSGVRTIEETSVNDEQFQLAVATDVALMYPLSKILLSVLYFVSAAFIDTAGRTTGYSVRYVVADDLSPYSLLTNRVNRY